MTLIEEYGVIYNESTKTITSVDEKKLKLNITLPPNFNGFSKIEAIGPNAFNFSKIKYIDLSKTEITTLYNSAFLFCFSLSGIILPNTIKRIETNAFVGTLLTSIYLPASLTTFDGYSFNQNGELDEYIVDKNNQEFCSVNGFVFTKDKTKLVRSPIHFEFEQIPCINLIQKIGNKAFSGALLTRFIATPNLTELDVDTFHACSKMKFIDLSQANIEAIPEGLFGDSNVLSKCRTIILPRKTKKISTKTFNTSSLRSLIIPEKTEIIESGAFININALTNIVILTNNSFSCETILCSKRNPQLVVRSHIFYQSDTFSGIKVKKEDYHSLLLSLSSNKICTVCKKDESKTRVLLFIFAVSL